MSDDVQAFVYDSPANRMSKRGRGAAGFGLLTPNVSENLAAMAAEFADTLIVQWPAKDGGHKALWQIFARLGKNVTAVISNVMPASLAPFTMIRVMENPHLLPLPLQMMIMLTITPSMLKLLVLSWVH